MHAPGPASGTEVVDCDHCQAVCCRLTVVLMPEDDVAEHLRDRNENGVAVLAKGADGWCLALDRQTMRCSIYDTRPDTCRRFAMAGPYCRSERQRWQEISLQLLP
ncbi:MAG TPA: YkgJ family cysteine cluster protein [Arenimonas sp.]|uniref:YkgJ family cysteine cluster protein n=1 Tax=Arenimonas sp. TaxID=1872635 RepID=UPI002C9330D6|nr:YkgJ family cysteine cluster protein [Arenimonas sp.]HMB56207.1 YkgJ family cysteine cluster protein [Arenimonas sp.]